MDVLRERNEHRRAIMAWVVFGLALAALFHRVCMVKNEVECYVCGPVEISEAPKECTKQKCQGVVCYKTVTKTQSHTRVHKGCVPYPVPEPNGCVDRSPFPGADVRDCYCDKPKLCNAAPSSRHRGPLHRFAALIGAGGLVVALQRLG